jgi:hypothetical protein
MKRDQSLAPKLFAPRRDLPAPGPRSRSVSEPQQGRIPDVRPPLAPDEKKIDIQDAIARGPAASLCRRRGLSHQHGAGLRLSRLDR